MHAIGPSTRGLSQGGYSRAYLFEDTHGLTLVDTLWDEDAHMILRYLFLAAALAPIILLYIVIRDHELSWPRGEMTAVIGIIAFGLVGYLTRKLDYPSAPLILGLVLGGAMERALRQSLMMSEGSLSILVSRPISAVMLSLAALILLIPVFSQVNAWRLQALEQDQQ